jgi:hypothetical protein
MQLPDKKSQNLNVNFLEKLKENLEKQIGIAYEQLSSVTDDVDYERLDRKIEILNERLSKAEHQLSKAKRLSGQGSSHRYCYNSWEEHFPKINFSQASRICDSIFNRFEDRGGAVFFLLQNCHPMGGKWCVNKIKASLTEKGILSSREVGFSAWEQPNQTDFIRRLGASLGIEVNTARLEQATQAIISKIHESVQEDIIILIEIKIFSIDTENDFLGWLINQFWVPLIRQLPAINQNNDLPVKFIAVMTAETTIPTNETSTYLFCERGKFNSQKIIELELHNWTEREIKKWLFRFSGLDTQRMEREIKHMARAIYQGTQGRPIEVHSVLMEELTKVFG